MLHTHTLNAVFSPLVILRQFKFRDDLQDFCLEILIKVKSIDHLFMIRLIKLLDVLLCTARVKFVNTTGSVCVNYNSAPKTVITVHFFVIFLSQGIVANAHSPEWGQPLLKKFSVVLFCSVLRDVHRCKSKNITGVDCGSTAGVKSA